MLRFAPDRTAKSDRELPCQDGAIRAGWLDIKVQPAVKYRDRGLEEKIKVLIKGMIG